jgi:hypothetical protein
MSELHAAFAAPASLPSTAPDATSARASAARRARTRRRSRVLGHLPRAAWICGLVASLNAVSWSFISPPFQVPDEPSHFAYVKQLTETGSTPVSGEERYSPEETLVLEALKYEEVRQHPGTGTIASQAEQQNLTETLSRVGPLPKQGSPDAGVATSEPPLYYALQSIPYLLGSHGTLLDRLQLMRLLSALIAGLTAVFTFLFLRETLPALPWAWAVGALAVAFSPLFGFMSGAVNPDSMLFAVSAALFYCLARAFRRGLTVRSAIALGLVIAVGFMTKLSFVGLAPGAFVGLFVVAMRGVRRSGRGALRAPALAAAIGCLPAVAFLTAKVFSHHSAIGIVSGTIKATHGSVLATASYIWQLYLPRLPGMAHDFPGIFTARQIWFDGYIGRFGWLDTFFPSWVYTLALIVAVVIAGLCARSLIAARAALRAHLAEVAVYALMTLGVLVLVGADSSLIFPRQLASYGQARYLLPMLPLLGAVLALAARGVGKRWGPAAGALIVTLFIAHDLFSQLQVIARYYG